jgi:hypothetical protein
MRMILDIDTDMTDSEILSKVRFTRKGLADGSIVPPKVQTKAAPKEETVEEVHHEKPVTKKPVTKKK